ncbi:helix-turn-helix domain-containing protein [Labrys wisconsinensis]|uniref:Transcriptional regulator with XRE-family HTH domain n=1 Tax=Labrys wisconsinensis TaxID=425677 RepID=A0ABU0J6T0_9HYPH|nr:cupin domain-containing protein [Labrys wisconsinensis]MDQ0469975.1 transcriptional regulator with XRE-family HTH domain [Labrys wisconsinensis]
MKIADEAARTPTAMSYPDQENQKLGQRIRDLRLKAGMTLSDLSKATGVSIGTLSQLERGLVSPTVRTVYTVANALGVMPAWLIDPSQSPIQTAETRYIVRAGQRSRLLDIDGIRKDIASPAASERLRGFFMVIQPGCNSGAQPYSHKGEEIGFLLSGSLELQIDGETFSLNEGDCFAFSSNKPHHFANPGSRPASVFWVNADI